jgi:hypothetical protein
MSLFISTSMRGLSCLTINPIVYCDVPLHRAYTEGDALRLIPASVEAK